MTSALKKHDFLVEFSRVAFSCARVARSCRMRVRSSSVALSASGYDLGSERGYVSDYADSEGGASVVSSTIDSPLQSPMRPGHAHAHTHSPRMGGGSGAAGQGLSSLRLEGGVMSSGDEERDGTCEAAAPSRTLRKHQR